ncbi:kelch repeat protein [Teladorsagia circumcincta]|uniref:Kelch repeat protein n=1 Tax=Teladorsagia circumcincta TaxID=45464 RepID=A0A2G9U5B0_TELCI|nr:kelch repeat protein [Teladorsagia circumcincta]
MSTKRKYLGTAVIDDCLYAVGGRDDSNCPLSSVEKYDARTNKWTTVAAMNSTRSGVALAAVEKKQLYAVGGFDGTAYLETVEVFDPEENQWKHHSRMNNRRHEAGVGVIYIHD